jgi:hypothetical protein
MLVAAVAIAISPIGIVPAVLLVVSPRGRVSGPAFLVGWLSGIGVVGATLLLLAGDAGASDAEEPARWVSWLKLGLGGVLLQEQATPAWTGALESFSPPKAAGVGALLSGVNPKNALLVAAGMAAVAETGAPAGEQAVALARLRGDRLSGRRDPGGRLARARRSRAGPARSASSVDDEERPRRDDRRPSPPRRQADRRRHRGAVGLGDSS